MAHFTKVRTLCASCALGSLGGLCTLVCLEPFKTMFAPLFPMLQVHQNNSTYKATFLNAMELEFCKNSIAVQSDAVLIFFTDSQLNLQISTSPMHP